MMAELEGTKNGDATTDESRSPGSHQRRTFRAAMGWLLLWLSSFIVVTILLKADLIDRGGLAYAWAVVPTVFGVIGARRYLRFLRCAGEPQRGVHLEALALAILAGSLAMLGFRLIERAGAPQMDVNDPFIVMLVFWGVGLWRAQRRLE